MFGNWSAYLAIENELAIELEDKIDSDTRPDSLVDRFSADSLTFNGQEKFQLAAWDLLAITYRSAVLRRRPGVRRRLCPQR